jgi:hypothetical protein
MYSELAIKYSFRSCVTCADMKPIELYLELYDHSPCQIVVLNSSPKYGKMLIKRLSFYIYV